MQGHRGKETMGGGIYLGPCKKMCLLQFICCFDFLLVHQTASYGTKPLCLCFFPVSHTSGGGTATLFLSCGVESLARLPERRGQGLANWLPSHSCQVSSWAQTSAESCKRLAYPWRHNNKELTSSQPQQQRPHVTALTNHFLAKTSAGVVVTTGAHVGYLLATVVTEPSPRPELCRSIPEVWMPSHYPRTVGDIRPTMKRSEREKRIGRSCAYICWNLGATGKGIILDRSFADQLAQVDRAQQTITMCL